MSVRVIWTMGALLLTGLTQVTAQAAPPPDIDWRDDPTASVEEARKTGRPIVVFVTSDRCGYCRKMEREAWSSRRVRQLLDGEYVALRVSAQTSPDVVRRLGIRAFPTTLRFSPDGLYQDGFAGFVDGETLSRFLSSAPSSPSQPAR